METLVVYVDNFIGSIFGLLPRFWADFGPKFGQKVGFYPQKSLKLHQKGPKYGPNDLKIWGHNLDILKKIFSNFQHAPTISWQFLDPF